MYLEMFLRVVRVKLVQDKLQKTKIYALLANGAQLCSSGSPEE
jgi:hypothetical protein